MSDFQDIVRSLFCVDKAEEKPTLDNYAHVRLDRLVGLTKPQAKILEYLLGFKTNHAAPPTQQTVERWAETQYDPELTKIVEEAALAVAFHASDFEEAFEREVAAQAAEALLTACHEAVAISGGTSTKPNAPRGIESAVTFLYGNVKVPPPKNDAGIPADMKAARTMLLAEYDKRKANPQQAYGIPSGYSYIDDATGGFKKKGLYLHAGFAGHLKSTQMLNMIVNAATYGWNELLFTSEMPATEVKFSLIVIHSKNPKFASYGVRLSQNKMIRGQLSDPERDHMELVYDDLVNNPDHGSIRVIDSGDFTGFASIKQRAVQEDLKEPIHMMWVDYLTRLPVEVSRGSGINNLRDARNELIADAKRFAMAFRKGEGLAVGSPFQVNRTGLKEGVDRVRKGKTSEGVLDVNALAEYSAAEKEADGISYIFYGPAEVSAQQPKGGIIKSRWGGVTVTAVPLHLNADARYICDYVPMPIAPGTAPDEVPIL